MILTILFDQVASSSPLERGREYTVSITGLSSGNASLAIVVDGVANHGAPSSDDVFSFNRVNELFIGGARDLNRIEVRFLWTYCS